MKLATERTVSGNYRPWWRPLLLLRSMWVIESTGLQRLDDVKTSCGCCCLSARGPRKPNSSPSLSLWEIFSTISFPGLRNYYVIKFCSSTFGRDTSWQRADIQTKTTTTTLKSTDRFSCSSAARLRNFHCCQSLVTERPLLGSHSP